MAKIGSGFLVADLMPFELRGVDGSKFTLLNIDLRLLCQKVGSWELSTFSSFLSVLIMDLVLASREKGAPVCKHESRLKWLFHHFNVAEHSCWNFFIQRSGCKNKRLRLQRDHALHTLKTIDLGDREGTNR